MTPATSYAGSANGSAVVAVVPPGTGMSGVGHGGGGVVGHGNPSNDLLLLQENPDLLKQLSREGSKRGSSAATVLADDEIRLALLNATCNAVSKQKQMLLSQNHHGQKILETVDPNDQDEGDSSESSPPPPMVPKRSTSYDIFKAKQDPKLSPPTPFADDSFGVPMPHIMSKTLPRRLPTGSVGGGNGLQSESDSPRGPASRGRKSLTTEVAIPPPPQYKGVHFAPQVIERRRSSSEATDVGIPVEGLPTRPAGSNGLSGQQHPPQGQQPTHPKAETVAIQVRNNPVPLLSAVMKSSAAGGGSHSGGRDGFGNISSFEHKKQPPQPPPKTSTLTSKVVMGVRDKALAASAAGCEIVFVSPDEGFNEEVLTSNSAVSTSAASTASTLSS